MGAVRNKQFVWRALRPVRAVNMADSLSESTTIHFKQYLHGHSFIQSDMLCIGRVARHRTYSA